MRVYTNRFYIGDRVIVNFLHQFDKCHGVIGLSIRSHQVIVSRLPGGTMDNTAHYLEQTFSSVLLVCISMRVLQLPPTTSAKSLHNGDSRGGSGGTWPLYRANTAKHTVLRQFGFGIKDIFGWTFSWQPLPESPQPSTAPVSVAGGRPNEGEGQRGTVTLRRNDRTCMSSIVSMSVNFPVLLNLRLRLS